MTNYEILKECKILYELLNDLRDNCGLLDNTINIDNMIDEISNIYTMAYEKELKINKDYLKPKKTIKCNRCGNDMYISDLIGYAYLCKNCDENMYLCEGDTNYAWWEEREER